MSEKAGNEALEGAKKTDIMAATGISTTSNSNTNPGEKEKEKKAKPSFKIESMPAPKIFLTPGDVAKTGSILLNDSKSKKANSTDPKENATIGSANVGSGSGLASNLNSSSNIKTQSKTKSTSKSLSSSNMSNNGANGNLYKEPETLHKKTPSFHAHFLTEDVASTPRSRSRSNSASNSNSEPDAGIPKDHVHNMELKKMQSMKRGSVVSGPGSGALSNASSSASSIDALGSNKQTSVEKRNVSNGTISASTLASENLSNAGSPIIATSGTTTTTNTSGSVSGPASGQVSGSSKNAGNSSSGTNNSTNNSGSTGDPRLPQNDGKIHILLGATGSISTGKLRQIILKLEEVYGKDKASVQIILTKAAEHFVSRGEIPSNVRIWRDSDEWTTWKSRTDPVLHIELRRWADILVICPLSANTLGKIALGLCDNLLTNVIRAWNTQYPVLIAPAMLSYAYNHPATKRHLKTIKEDMKWIEVLKPVEKVVGSYGDIGMGGMMDYNEIVNKIVMKLGGYPEEDDEDEDDEDDNDDDDDDDNNKSNSNSFKEEKAKTKKHDGKQQIGGEDDSDDSDDSDFEQDVRQRQADRGRIKEAAGKELDEDAIEDDDIDVQGLSLADEEKYEQEHKRQQKLRSSKSFS